MDKLYSAETEIGSQDSHFKKLLLVQNPDNSEYNRISQWIDLMPITVTLMPITETLIPITFPFQ